MPRGIAIGRLLFAYLDSDQGEIWKMDALKGLMDLARRFSVGQPFLMLLLALLWLDTVLAWNGQGLWLHAEIPIAGIVDALLKIPVRVYLLFALATLAAWIIGLPIVAWVWLWSLTRFKRWIRDQLDAEIKVPGRGWMHTQVAMDLATRSKNEILYQR